MSSLVAEFNAVSRSGYDDMIIKTVYEQSAIYKLLGQHKRIFRGGFDEKIPIEYRALDQTEAVHPDDTIDYTTRDTITQAVIEPRFVVARELVRWREKQANQRESKIIDIVSYKTERLMRDFKNAFHNWLFTTTDPDTLEKKPPDSLTKLIAAGDLYGVPVSSGNAEDWKSYVHTTAEAPVFYGPGNNSLATRINYATFEDSAVGGGNGVTHVLCSRDMFTSLHALWYAKVGEIMVDGGTKSLGLSNFMFEGCKFVKDYACPNTQIHGIDFKSGLLCMEDPDQPEVDDWFSLEQVGRPRDMAKVVTWVGNFVIQQRRTNFRYSAATLPTAANLQAGNLA